MAFKNQHPLNAQLLFVWTLMEAYTVGVVCALRTRPRVRAGSSSRRWCSRRLIFASLTFYTVYSKPGLELHGSWLVFWFTPPHFLGPVLVVLPGAGGRPLQPLWRFAVQRLHHLILADHGADTTTTSSRRASIPRHPQPVPVHPEAPVAGPELIVPPLDERCAIHIYLHDNDYCFMARRPADRTRMPHYQPRRASPRPWRRWPPRPPPAAALRGKRGCPPTGRPM